MYIVWHICTHLASCIINYMYIYILAIILQTSAFNQTKSDLVVRTDLLEPYNKYSYSLSNVPI